MKRINNKELLERIEKLENLTARLEQGIQDIWASCSCLTKDLDIDDLPIQECPGGIFEEPEPFESEHECEDGCPSCSHFEDEFPEEEPEEPDKEIDHDN